jgi:hypothetical protein
MRLVSELRRLYRRYLSLHAECRFADIKLGQGDDVVGYVEECVFTRDSLRLRGWTLSHRLRLEIGGTRHALPRRIQRGDVAVAMGARMLATGNQHGRVGFELTLPRVPGPARLLPRTCPAPAPGPCRCRTRT